MYVSIKSFLVTFVISAWVVDAQKIRLPVGLQWTNNAWGDSNSKDSNDGMKVVVVDLFDAPKSRIEELKTNNHIVICYISAGSVEDWREDVKANPNDWKAIQGKNMGDWEGETWIDITKLELIKPLMMKRFETAKEKGCQGLELDNVDCYQNDCVAGETESQLKSYQLAYNIWSTEMAEGLGLIIGLKNSVGLISYLEPYYDFAINESCQVWNECDQYKRFTDADKAVFGTEYRNTLAEVCDKAKPYSMMTKLSTTEGWTNCFSGVTPLPATLFTNQDPDNSNSNPTSSASPEIGNPSDPEIDSSASSIRNMGTVGTSVVLLLTWVF